MSDERDRRIRKATEAVERATRQLATARANRDAMDGELERFVAERCRRMGNFPTRNGQDADDWMALVAMTSWLDAVVSHYAEGVETAKGALYEARKGVEEAA